MVLIVIRPDTIGRNPISLARVLPNEEKTDVAIIAAPMQNKQEDVEGDAPDDPHTPEDGQRRQRNAVWRPDRRSPRESQRATIIVCGGKPDDQRWDMRNGNQPSRSRGTFIRLNRMNGGSRPEPRVSPAGNGQGPPSTAGSHKSGLPHTICLRGDLRMFVRAPMLRKPGFSSFARFGQRCPVVRRLIGADPVRDNPAHTARGAGFPMIVGDRRSGHHSGRFRRSGGWPAHMSVWKRRRSGVNQWVSGQRRGDGDQRGELWTEGASYVTEVNQPAGTNPSPRWNSRPPLLGRGNRPPSLRP